MSEHTEVVSFNAKLNDFLKKYSIVFVVILGIAILAVVALSVYSFISSENIKQNAIIREEVKTAYDLYTSEADTAKKAELEKTLFSTIDAAVLKFPNGNASERSLFIKAEILFTEKKFAEAYDVYIQIAKIDPKGQIAPLALNSAAVCAEEANNLENAIATYTKIAADYEKKAPGVAHAWFSIGRLNEEKKENAAALKAYEKLVELYPLDNWTKLAKARIIVLKTLSGL